MENWSASGRRPATFFIGAVPGVIISVPLPMGIGCWKACDFDLSFISHFIGKTISIYRWNFVVYYKAITFILVTCLTLTTSITFIWPMCVCVWESIAHVYNTHTHTHVYIYTYTHLTLVLFFCLSLCLRIHCGFSLVAVHFLFFCFWILPVNSHRQ